MAQGDNPGGEGQKGHVSRRPKFMNRSAVVWRLLGMAAAQGFSCWGYSSPQCQGPGDSDDASHAVLRAVEGGAGSSSGRTSGSLTRWLLEGFSRRRYRWNSGKRGKGGARVFSFLETQEALVAGGLLRGPHCLWSLGSCPPSVPLL